MPTAELSLAEPHRTTTLDCSPGRSAPLVRAYLDALDEVVTSGDWVDPVLDQASVGSNFGRGRGRTIELLCHTASFPVASPTLISPLARPVDPVFACGHLLWALAGSKDVRWIAYYNERGRAFSSDGVTLDGAPGPRLMGPGQPLVDHVDLLRRDPSTRRALLPMIGGSGAWLRSNDVPCQVGLQHWVRNGAVRGLSLMRSQSAALLWPLDAFFASSIQCLVAAELALPVGSHDYFSASLHIYEDERETVDRIRVQGVIDAPFAPVTQGLSALPRVLAQEARLRAAALSGSRDAVLRAVEQAPEFEGFWSEVLTVLSVSALLRVDLTERAETYLRQLPLGVATALRIRQ